MRTKRRVLSTTKWAFAMNDARDEARSSTTSPARLLRVGTLEEEKKGEREGKKKEEREGEGEKKEGRKEVVVTAVRSWKTCHDGQWRRRCVVRLRLLYSSQPRSLESQWVQCLASCPLPPLRMPGSRLQTWSWR